MQGKISAADSLPQPPEAESTTPTMKDIPTNQATALQQHAQQQNMALASESPRPWSARLGVLPLKRSGEISQTAKTAQNDTPHTNNNHNNHSKACYHRFVISTTGNTRKAERRTAQSCDLARLNYHSPRMSNCQQRSPSVSPKQLRKLPTSSEQPRLVYVVIKPQSHLLQKVQ